MENFLRGVHSKEERKAQLRAAAQDMKQTGKAEAAFEESSYGVGDDKSPNIHTRVSLSFWLSRSPALVLITMVLM